MFSSIARPNKIMLPKMILKIDKNISAIHPDHGGPPVTSILLNIPPMHNIVIIVKSKMAVKNFCIKHLVDIPMPGKKNLLAR
jgi:hypothetical protein